MIYSLICFFQVLLDYLHGLETLEKRLFGLVAAIIWLIVTVLELVLIRDVLRSSRDPMWKVMSTAIILLLAIGTSAVFLLLIL
jgi:hypothetical protein